VFAGDGGWYGGCNLGSAKEVPMRILLVFAAALVTTPALAHNHFILEGDVGVGVPVGVDADAEPGGTFGGTFGFGGRIPGQSPAYYLVGRVGRAGFGFRGPERYGSAAVELRQTELSAGGRVYLPITNRTRISAQLTLGGTFDSAEVDREGHDRFDYEDTKFTIFTDLGLQHRLTDHLSLGLVGGLSWLPDRENSSFGALAAGLDDGPVGRARVGVTTTIHF